MNVNKVRLILYLLSRPDQLGDIVGAQTFG